MEISRITGFARERGLLYVYGLFMLGYFLLPMASGHRRLYYLCVVPVLVFLWRDSLALARRNSLLLWILAYTAWMSLSLLWTADFELAAAGWQLWVNASLISFVLATGLMWRFYAPQLPGLTTRLLFVAAAAATVSMVAFYLQHPFPDARLKPLGVMHHQNKGGAAYGLLLIVTARLWQTEPPGRRRQALVLVAILLSALVLLTQSRTALIACCVALAAVFGKRALPALAAGVAASFTLVASNPETWWHRVQNFSFRPGIWKQVITDMDGAWLLGHGYLLNPEVFAYQRRFDHAHNGYLASLRDGGIPALLLLAGIVLTALAWSWRIFRNSGERLYIALLLYSMTAIFMDFDRLLVHPKELWLFFWLPLALIAAVYPTHAASAQTPDTAPVARDTS